MTKIEKKKKELPKDLTLGNFFSNDKYKNDSSRIKAEAIMDGIRAIAYFVPDTLKLSPEKGKLFFEYEQKRKGMIFKKNESRKKLEFWGTDLKEYIHESKHLEYMYEDYWKQAPEDITEIAFIKNQIRYFSKQLDEAEYLKTDDITFYTYIEQYIHFLENRKKELSNKAPQEKQKTYTIKELFKVNDKLEKIDLLLEKNGWLKNGIILRKEFLYNKKHLSEPLTIAVCLFEKYKSLELLILNVEKIGYNILLWNAF